MYRQREMVVLKHAARLQRRFFQAPEMCSKLSGVSENFKEKKERERKKKNFRGSAAYLLSQAPHQTMLAWRWEPVTPLPGTVPAWKSTPTANSVPVMGMSASLLSLGSRAMPRIPSWTEYIRKESTPAPEWQTSRNMKDVDIDSWPQQNFQARVGKLFDLWGTVGCKIEQKGIEAGSARWSVLVTNLTESKNIHR